jgi:hypothetical protein
MEETPRASDLQVHVEQVTLALKQLRHTQETLTGLETRLADMTRECADILDRWARNDERHATAVVELHSRLSEWNDIERRLLSESTSRIHQFERSLQHEWNAIRQSHEEPLRQIEAQTTRITETCLTAVEQALKGFAGAESRLATLEQDLQREMGTLAREVREAVAELRQGGPQIGARQPWSLDNVVRLHNELRAEGQGTPGAGRGTLALAEAIDSEPVAAAQPLEPAPAPASRAQDIALLPPAAPARAGRWLAWAAAAALVVGGVYAAAQVRAGLRDATARAEAAERAAREERDRATRDIAAAQQAADARLQAAQQAVRSAQIVSAVAAAGDLRRFDLAARDGAGVAQVLWSRSQGVAVTGSGLPAAAAGQAYQLWLLTPDRAIGVGLLPVEPSGRASAAFEPDPGLPRPIVRAMITLEPASGSDAPTGPAVLAQAPAPAPVS